MTEIVIAIPTFRRPKMLKRLLETLELQETQSSISVLVADNDAESCQGFDVCQSMASAYRWTLRVVIVRERGIAQARNALVAAALECNTVDFIVMIDDDEWPATDWLDELLKVQCETDADAVGGSVLFCRREGHAYPLDDIRGKTGRVEVLYGAGNLMIRASRLRAMQPPWFDPAFALTGGEDGDFFMRLHAEGAHFAWADNARTYSDIPVTRANLSWGLMRAFSHGNSGMLVMLKHRPGISTWLVESTKILGVLLLFGPLALLFAPLPQRRKPLEKVFRSVGKLSALFGYRYQEYAVIHGD